MARGREGPMNLISIVPHNEYEYSTREYMVISGNKMFQHPSDLGPIMLVRSMIYDEIHKKDEVIISSGRIGCPLSLLPMHTNMVLSQLSGSKTVFEAASGIPLLSSDGIDFLPCSNAHFTASSLGQNRLVKLVKPYIQNIQDAKNGEDPSELLVTLQTPPFFKKILQTSIPDYEELILQTSISDCEELTLQTSIPDCEELALQTSIPDCEELTLQTSIPDHKEFYRPLYCPFSGPIGTTSPSHTSRCKIRNITGSSQ
ncbi:hypothetical protein HispidOSU_027799 [Sigmodon hispidus]